MNGDSIYFIELPTVKLLLTSDFHTIYKKQFF